MNINFFADTICGWCFIGHRNLNSALKKFPKIKFKIKHIPFQLNPDMPAEGVLREKSGTNPSKMIEALSGGWADSKILQTHGKRMINKDLVTKEKELSLS